VKTSARDGALGLLLSAAAPVCPGWVSGIPPLQPWTNTIETCPFRKRRLHRSVLRLLNINGCGRSVADRLLELIPDPAPPSANLSVY